ncbi:FadR/GntR family transcriptional regulator [Arthrobacter sp. NPDC090010]|uniref:FadR/GntR family transcriptional regulator n=1 Tax=Arthrobacter sp. NPDC090010 TaxID=3363942 RepID=UPI003828ACE2
MPSLTSVHAPGALELGDRFRTLILEGAWPVGFKVPNDAALSREFNASLGAVKEAVRGLVHTGLLEARSGRGTFVKATNELVSAVEERARDECTLHAMEAREALESRAVALAAERITAEQLGRLDEALQARGAASDLAELTRADIAFHRLIVEATGNRLLEDMYEGLDQARIFDLSGLRDTSPEESLQAEHQAVLDALRSRDPGRATSAALVLLSRVRTKVLGPDA